MLFMVFDVESMGLYGEGFAFGFVVYDDGVETASGLHACPYSCIPADPTSLDSMWVHDNVKLPGYAYDCHSPRHLRDIFWDVWSCWQARGALLCADVCYPVETNFLRDCIKENLFRMTRGPYPLLDIASIRFAKGFDPLETVERLPDELPAHNPLADARQSGRLLLEALNLVG